MSSPAALPDLARFDRYLALDPGNMQLRMSAVDAALAAGAVERARAYLDVALGADPANLHLRHKLGAVLLAEGRQEECAQLLQALLAETMHPAVAFNLAQVLFGLARFGEALAAMQPFAAAPGQVAGFGALYMRLLHQAGELEQAVDWIGAHEGALAQDPQFLGAASLVCLDAGQLAAARRLAGRAAAAGASVEAQVTLGSLALGADDAAAAQASFESSLRLAPGEPRALAGMGMVRLLRGEGPEAQALLEDATGRSPRHIGTWHLLGWSRIVNLQLPAARDAFQAALDLDRNFGESHGGMAVVHALSGDRREAQAACDRAFGLDAGSMSAQYARMVLAGDVQDPARFKQLALAVLQVRQGGEIASRVLRRWGGPG